MYTFPVLEEDGLCVSATTHNEPTRRWISRVQLERDSDYARLKEHVAEPKRVPNDYPSEALAVQAAYNHARQLLAQERAWAEFYTLGL